MIWDVTGIAPNGRLQPQQLTKDQLVTFWQQLSQPDGIKAHKAIWSMIANGNRTVTFLDRQLKKVEPVSEEQIAQWIRNLNDRKFAVREKAVKQLEMMAGRAEKPLREALSQRPALEMRRRVEALIQQIEKEMPSPAQLQALRSLEVLQQIGSTEAKKVLRRITKGDPDAILTQEAEMALSHCNRP